MDLNKAEKILIEAIQNTPKNQIWVNDDQNSLLPERGITINFILQLYSLNPSYFFNSCDNLYFSGEYEKVINKKITYPDIIFHGGQNNIANQIFACEIKKFPSIKAPSNHHLLFYDFYKLVNYLYLKRWNKKELKYDDADYKMVYMILIDSDKKDFSNLLRSFKLSSLNKNRKKEVQSIRMIRRYLHDEKKQNRLRIILIPKNYDKKIDILSLEDIIHTVPEFQRLIESIKP